MLFLPPGKSEPVRVQGAFIGTEESEAITDWYAEQKRLRDEALEAQGLIPPDEAEMDILEQIAAIEIEAQDGEDGAGAGGVAERDVLFIEAAEICLQHQQGSTSLLQRKLRIGYGRAARIIDQLHDAGILGPPDGSKPRDVLIGPSQLEEYSQ
jgi:S-DNA-T family DNA segregation ATPase FtsK/SpoIIIE